VKFTEEESTIKIKLICSMIPTLIQGKNRKNYDQVVGNDDQEKNSASSTLFDNDGAQLISLIHDTLRQNQK
jgi:hypothetical protein